MLNRMHERLGTAGFIVSVIALVFALAGGAYAAKNGLSGKQKKEVKSIATSVAKGLQGTGPQGPKGDPGAAGAAGKDGTNGTPGAPGADGKLVEVTPVASGALECEGRGGALLEEEGSSAPAVEVCSGEEGSPWTAGGVLPPGATETGTWAFHGGTEKVTVVTETEPTATQEVTIGDTEAWVPFSFTLPLPVGKTLSWVGSGAASNQVHFSGESNFSDFDGGGPEKLGCKGTAAGPFAPPGHLCVYLSPGTLEGASFTEPCKPGCGTNGSGRYGGFLVFSVTENPASAQGTWIVKAPCAEDEEIVEEANEAEFVCVKKSA